MKRRTKLLLLVVTAALLLVLVPVFYIQGLCSTPLAGFSPHDYRAMLPERSRRAEVRTWLTYPEWHIVYSAESYGGWLAAGERPSGYHYLRDVRRFWGSYCTVNQAVAHTAGAGDSKLMIFTIGISFTVEMAVKALYENTIGRLAEAAGGWDSADDRYSAKVQQDYGAFMYETPWYRFPFGEAVAGLWRTEEPTATLRHFERRIGLTGEYGVKAGYAKLIDAASGATLGRDETQMRLVYRGSPGQARAIDARLKPVAAKRGFVVVATPRYAQFTELVRKMVRRPLALVEIAGNDDIFVTLIAKTGFQPRPTDGVIMFDMPLPDKPGMSRIGLSTKVPTLLPMLRRVEARGARLEHVYDY